jgi:hypothetical protein
MAGYYNRSSVALRVHQRVRLTTTASTNVQANCPANLGELFGSYWVARCAGGRIWVSVSDSGRPPFDRTVAATSGPHDSEAKLAFDPRGGALCFYCRRDSSANTFASFTFSDDDGLTWSGPTDLITGGIHPNVAAGYDGGILFVAYVSGKLKGVYQEPGELVPGSLFTLKDDAGADLLVANDSFGLTQTFDLQARWWLHVTIQGDSLPSSWFSTNEGASWTRSA